MIPLVCRDISLIEDRLTENAEIPLSFGDPAKELLVSGCTKEETAKRLKLLYRLARTDLEESGVNTLFLALGFLRWKPSGAGTRTYRAPCL